MRALRQKGEGEVVVFLGFFLALRKGLQFLQLCLGRGVRILRLALGQAKQQEIDFTSEAFALRNWDKNFGRCSPPRPWVSLTAVMGLTPEGSARHGGSHGKK